jgi:hypothetical protein
LKRYDFRKKRKKNKVLKKGKFEKNILDEKKKLPRPVINFAPKVSPVTESMVATKL